MASITEIAEQFFVACDEGKGWEGFDLLPSLKDLGFWDHQSAADWVGLMPSPPAEEAPSA